MTRVVRELDEPRAVVVQLAFECVEARVRRTAELDLSARLEREIRPVLEKCDRVIALEHDRPAVAARELLEVPADAVVLLVRDGTSVRLHDGALELSTDQLLARPVAMKRSDESSAIEAGGHGSATYHGASWRGTLSPEVRCFARRRSSFSAAACPHLYSSVDDSEAAMDLPENNWKTCGGPESDFADEPTGYDEGERFPDARLADQNGDIVSMWQFTGCVAIVDLSTGWCGPCQQLARQVDDLYAAHGAEGLHVRDTAVAGRGRRNRRQLEDVEWASDFGVTTTPILADPSPGRPVVLGRDHAPAFPRILSIGRDMRVANPTGRARRKSRSRTAVERLLANVTRTW